MADTDPQADSVTDESDNDFQGQDGDGPGRNAILKSAAEDTREYLNLQNQAMNQMESDARATIRLTLLIFGLLLTAGSVFFSSPAEVDRQFARLKPFINEAFIAGFFATVGSTLTAFSASVTSKKIGGLSGDSIREILEGDLSELEFRERLLKGHRNWMRQNFVQNRRDANFLRLSNIFLASGLIYFLLAIYWGLAPKPDRPIMVGVIVFTFFLVAAVGLLPQTRYWGWPLVTSLFVFGFVGWIAVVVAVLAFVVETYRTDAGSLTGVLALISIGGLLVVGMAAPYLRRAIGRIIESTKDL